MLWNLVLRVWAPLNKLRKHINDYREYFNYLTFEHQSEGFLAHKGLYYNGIKTTDK